MITIKKYSLENKKIWDSFITNSKNGHFMFSRNFMEYHSDKFIDFSLMFFDSENVLLALMPANLSSDVLYTHQGLTFGGLILSNKTSVAIVIDIFELLRRYLKDIGVKKLVYKRVPDLYHQHPSQEDLYAFFRLGVRLTRVDINSTVYLGRDYYFSKGRKWSINKAKKENILVRQEICVSRYWPLLESVLAKYSVKPTHKLTEIESLMKSFPNNIKLFCAYKDDELLAGTVLFINKHVMHTQYMATSELGKKIGALDLLISSLMKDGSLGVEYFNFGISTEQNGTYINEGLLAQKEGFGARTTVHEFYEMEIK